MPSVTFDNSQQLVRVNFHNRGLSRVLKSVRSLNRLVAERRSLVEVSHILRNIRVTRKSPTGWPSLPEFEGLDYIGYIIDKERLDKATGQWLRIDEYRIIGSKTASFKDSRVAYGQTYRYRMRSVIKVTKALVKESFEKFDLKEDVRQLSAEVIQKALMAQQEVISSVDRITNVGLTPQRSSGAQATATFDLLGGLSVAASAESTRLASTSSVTATSAATTLNSLRVNQNAVTDREMTAGTISAERLQKIIVEAITQFLEERFEFVSYYYESDHSPGWKYVSIREKIPPPPPQGIKIIPNTPQNKILVTWVTPAHSQRDIKQFKLYRRLRVGHDWTLIKTFSLRENLYEDRAVRLNRQYIYALTSVDAHGFESFLSTQTQAQLNPNFILEQQERPLKWISGSGARPDQGFDQVFKKFFEPEVPIVATENVVIGPQASFREQQRKLLVRIKSLDIHECKEFVISLRNENVQTPDSV